MLNNITNALTYVARAHNNQRRKDNDKSPYINHLLDVFSILVRAGVIDENILIASLLHDTVEDVGVTFEEIRDIFGSVVESLVREVTDDKSLDKVTRKREQILHAATASEGAKLIKTADKLSNLGDLSDNPPSNWSAEQVRGYWVWSWSVLVNAKSGSKELNDKVLELYQICAPWVLELGQNELEAELETYYEHISSMK